MNNAIDKYVKAHSKSHFINAILTVVLGPLGLLYTNWVAAIILGLIAFVTLSSILVPLVCWLLAIIIGVFSVIKHNRKVLASAELALDRQSNIA